jgi:serine/threonine-protein kinase
MGTKCPECNTVNPSDSKYCKECETSLPSPEDISVSRTKTIQKYKEKLVSDKLFASKYQIREELGRGGMGIVYKAEDTKLKRTVALKFLPPELARDKGAKERFIRESQAAAALDHPNICTVYEADEVEGKAFISMAYIEGESLREIIKNGPIKYDKAMEIALQVAEGLEEAHKKGIVHRDIKSANIMLTEKGQAKIMDFGLAKVAGSSLITKEATKMGTVAYMSPEQTYGEAVDHRTDIWSFGVVLYEMISGQLPFTGERESSIMYSIVHEEQKPLKDFNLGIPTEFEKVVEKAMAKKQDERYQKVDELLEDLKSIKEGLEPRRYKTKPRKARLPKVRRTFLYGIVVVLFVIFVAVGFLLLIGRPTAIDSVAVLPLENLSGDPRQDYFTDGMTQALIAELGKIGALRVISRQSVMQFKGSTKALPEIARELNVDAVVQGTVTLSGDRVRITANLIGAFPERHLWTETFDYDLGDVLVLHSKVAHDISKEIKIKLTPEEKKLLTSSKPVNAGAHKAYLFGQYYFNKFGEDDLWKAVDYFNQAIDKDPTYGSAYAGLADAFMILADVAGGHRPKDLIPKAKLAAINALELDEDLSDAYVSLGHIKYVYDWDWIGAENELTRAIELNPSNTWALLIYSRYLGHIGRHDQAIAENQRALALDPLSVNINVDLGTKYYWAGRYDQALQQLKKTLEINPNFIGAHYRLGHVYEQKGMLEAAITEHENAVKLSEGKPFMIASLGHAYALAGKTDEALKILSQLKELSKRMYISPYNMAMVYIGLNEKDQAFDWLEKALGERCNELVRLKEDPRSDILHSDPRFKTLMRTIGLE